MLHGGAGSSELGLEQGGQTARQHSKLKQAGETLSVLAPVKEFHS